MTKLNIDKPADFREFESTSAAQCIHRRIEDQVRLYPKHIAIKTPEAECTYAQMNHRANSLARGILDLAGADLAQAALLLPNSPDTIVAILASLKAHKAYVPLDPKLPKDRLHWMLKDVEPAVMITDDSHRGLARELCGSRIPIVLISEMDRYAGASNPETPCDPMDRAYILYTSGSTGTPKGIAFVHRNLVHHIGCMTDNLCFSASDRVTWLHSASFSASVVDVYSCLMNGGTLYPWDTKDRGFIGMADWLSGERVTTLQWIPSAFRQFLRTVPHDYVFRDMRLVVMASESLTIKEVELFRRHFPEGSRIVNQVGTSESYNYRLYSAGHSTQLNSAGVPAGYSVSPDREVLILDDAHRPLPCGQSGEIAVKSGYMSAGYWHNDELTSSKFIRIHGDDTPVYLTGDLGQLEPDGCLLHFGRKDNQVKIRGFRVELAEIDHILSQCGGVSDSVTRVVKNRAGDDQLVSYLILGGAGRYKREDTEAHLKSMLPEYMVPRHYVVIQAFSVLPNGKIDYRQLPNPFDSDTTKASHVGRSAEPLREKLVRLFAELLEMDRVTEDSDFLREGGDSLSMAVLLHRIHETWGVAIGVDRFLTSPTPRTAAALIEAALKIGQQKPPEPFLLTGTADVRNRIALMRARRTNAVETRSRIRLLRGKDGAGCQENLVIIGTGGLGRETFTWAKQAIEAGATWRIKGFLDKRRDAVTDWGEGAMVLGDPEDYEIEDGDVFVGAVGDPVMKVNCYAPILERGGRFVNVIHPLANIGVHVKLGSGIVAGPFSSITCDVEVGDHVSLGALSNLGHDTKVGDWCHISSHCGINGGAALGEGVFLGSHACIAPRVSLGAWSFVGAGSVVARDVHPDTKVFGNPAVFIGPARSRCRIERAPSYKWPQGERELEARAADEFRAAAISI